VFLKYTHKTAWVWFGKNSFPFWKQNEFFWDGDVNPEGVSAHYGFKELLGKNSKVGVTAGWYAIDNLDRLGVPCIGAGQLGVVKKTGEWVVKAAGGLFDFKNEGSDTVAGTYNPLEGMDHRIVTLSGQVAYKKLPAFPVKVGGDFLTNLLEPKSPGFEEQTSGYVAQISVGKLKSKGDFLFGFYYAHIEKYAVIANFAQDDWWRFGNGHTNSSNLHGFEVRLGYQPTKKINAVVRHYSAKMIKGDKKANRIRFDLNTKF